VRNIYRYLRPEATQDQGLTAARWTIVVVLGLGVLSAELMGDVESIVKLVLTVNVPFGAAILTVFFWRRLTAPAVWWSVSLTVLTILVVPNIATEIRSVRQASELAVMSTAAEAKPVPVYWKQLVRINPGDPASALEGRGRFSLECYLLGKVGLDVAKLTPQGREAATFYFDGLFPFMVLLLVSYLTRPTDKARVDQFYGKMKTPVGDTPELEAAAMEETRRNPGRFDHTKLVRDSTWEFCKWDRVDTIGFLICCAVSGAIIGIFVLLLKWAA
jgi:hypothetical protein